MALPVNVDSTYADSGTDASVALHQQHHDALHTRYNAPAVTGQATIYSGTPGTYYNTMGIPEAYLVGASQTNTYVAGQTLYVPMCLVAPISVTHFYASVSTAVASSTARFVIYNASASWDPGSAFYTSSTISTATTGDKLLDLSGSPVAVPAGRYMVALWCSDAVSVVAWMTAPREIGWVSTTGIPLNLRSAVNNTSAPPDPVTGVLGNNSATSPGLRCPLLMRWVAA